VAISYKKFSQNSKLGSGFVSMGATTIFNQTLHHYEKDLLTGSSTGVINPCYECPNTQRRP